MTTITTAPGSTGIVTPAVNRALPRPPLRRLRVVHGVSRDKAVEAAREQLRRRNEEEIPHA
jgi:hypothetical protein